MTDENALPDPLPETQDAVAPLDVAAAGATTATGDVADERDADDGPDAGPLADAPPLGDAPESRPREVVRGIHPELLCQCPECAPDYVELQWFSVDEQKKVKGDAMLFCARSARKYFTPILDLNAWLTEKGGPRKRGRGD